MENFSIEFSDGSLSSLRSCTSVYTPVVCRTSEVLGDVLKRYHVIDLLLYVRFLCTLQSQINFQHSTLSHPWQRFAFGLFMGDVLKRYHVIDLLLYVRFFMYTAVVILLPAYPLSKTVYDLFGWCIVGGNGCECRSRLFIGVFCAVRLTLFF